MFWLQHHTEVAVEAAEALPVDGCIELHQPVTQPYKREMLRQREP